MTLHSRIAEGHIRHRRFAPRAHSFGYRIAYLYLDLDELAEVFALSPFYSTQRFNLAQLRRSDFLTPTALSIKDAVRARIRASSGEAPEGPVRMLSHLRFWGYCFNPVTFYYAFDGGDRLHSIVAEINNTPWNERRAYVLRVDEARRREEATVTFEFDKDFHVSPFMPMALRYRWRFHQGDAQRVVHMQLMRDGARQFDATLNLHERPVTGAALNALVFRYPFATARTMTAIHWQALKLWLKGTPFHAHPSHHTTG